jgi:hypothetical protein
MNKPLAFLVIAVLAFFCGCRGSQPDAATTKPASGRSFVDLLEAQLVAIKYRTVVMRNGEALTVRVGTASAPGVRRAICHIGGWLSDNRMVHLDETLRRLHQEGVMRMQIISDTETMNVQINQQGKCEKGNAEPDGS